tara:strand:- start:428 stop:1249 length:822 start_codon:yes stop_codon:yes gene_type:complete
MQIKNNAKNDLIVGKYDEKLRNLYSSGMGYLDLYSDRPLASIIESNEDLHDVFNYKTNTININKNEPSAANVNQQNVNQNVEVEEDKPEKVSVDIQEFLNFPIQKGTSNAPSTDKLKEWKSNLKEATGWSKRNIETAANKLKSIYRDNEALKRLTPQQSSQKERLEKSINRKTMEFEGWLNSPGIGDMIKMPKFSEELKKMPLEQLKSQASLQLKGTGDSSWNNSIKAAREELKRRNQNIDIQNEWANMTQSQKDNLGVKTYQDFFNLATRTN